MRLRRGARRLGRASRDQNGRRHDAYNDETDRRRPITGEAHNFLRGHEVLLGGALDLGPVGQTQYRARAIESVLVTSGNCVAWTERPQGPRNGVNERVRNSVIPPPEFVDA